MLEYILILIFTSINAYFLRRFVSFYFERFGYFLIGLSLVLFAGLRNASVGSDTSNYIGWLSKVRSIEEAHEFPVELGYSLLVWVSQELSDSYAILLTLTAAFVVSLYLLVIRIFVHRYETALFVFITLGTYTFFFNGARQGI